MNWLQRRWKSFQKRSHYYKIATLYGALAFFFLVLSMLFVVDLCKNYAQDKSLFDINTASELRAIGFLTVFTFIIVIIFGVSVALFCLMLFYRMQDHDQLIKSQMKIMMYLHDEGDKEMEKQKKDE